MQELSEYPNLFIMDHPLIQHKLSFMRDENCSTQMFRELLKEISMLMGYEITRDLSLETKHIKTPIVDMDTPVLSGKKLVIVPILRAGLGMSDGLVDLIPSARVGHIGLYRDPETKKPVEYLVKLPSTAERDFIVVDPMLATGNSASYAIDVLVKHGVDKSRIKFMALVAAPEGIKCFHQDHPEIPIYLAALDERLNDNAYIVPGLGDAGDRIFGTK